MLSAERLGAGGTSENSPPVYWRVSVPPGQPRPVGTLESPPMRFSRAYGTGSISGSHTEDLGRVYRPGQAAQGRDCAPEGGHREGSGGVGHPRLKGAATATRPLFDVGGQLHVRYMSVGVVIGDQLRAVAPFQQDGLHLPLVSGRDEEAVPTDSLLLLERGTEC